MQASHRLVCLLAFHQLHIKGQLLRPRKARSYQGCAWSPQEALLYRQECLEGTNYTKWRVTWALSCSERHSHLLRTYSGKLRQKDCSDAKHLACCCKFNGWRVYTIIPQCVEVDCYKICPMPKAYPRRCCFDHIQYHLLCSWKDSWFCSIILGLRLDCWMCLAQWFWWTLLNRLR